jgi:hypothetical protein
MSVQWAKVATQYADLQALRVYALACTATAGVPGPFGWVDEETRTAVGTSLEVVGTYLQRLGPLGDLGQGLVSGDVTPERWAAVANAQGYAINDCLKSLGDSSGRVWDELVIQTGKDVAQVVKDTAGGFGVGLGAVAAALGAWYLLRGRA